MDSLKEWHGKALGKRAVQALEKNGFQAGYYADLVSASHYILHLVQDGASVGIGGSQTERALELGTKLKDKGCTVHDHGLPGLTVEERTEIRYRQLTADVFISGTNAITLKGELMNRDSNGNRVAAMMFGPKKVIVVAGVNKIVRNLEEADARIRMVAAPMNNKRLGTENPCVELGECVDCRNPTRICNMTTILSRRPPLSEFHVILIGEELGY